MNTPQEATGTSATPTANQEPPPEKQETPGVRQETPTPASDESSPSLASDSPTKAEDQTRAREPPVPDLRLGAEDLQAQGSKLDAAAVEAMAEASAESLRNTIQPQVDALWDSVKWMEDRMEIIDADRRGELEDAARTAARNTAKVSPRNGVLFEDGTMFSRSQRSVYNTLVDMPRAAAERLPSFVHGCIFQFCVFLCTCSLCRFDASLSRYVCNTHTLTVTDKYVVTCTIS